MNKIIYLLFTTLIVGCNTSTEQAALSETRQAKAKELGNKISLQAKNSLGSQLKKALKKGRPVEAVGFCHVAAGPILDTMNTALEVKIKRATLWSRNPDDLPTDPERKILERYVELNKKGKKMSPVVEVLSDSEVLYARPIVLNNPMCLSCHGEIGKEISSETYELIKEKYPEDNATGHKLGDLRGIWSITISREDLQ